MTLGDCKPGARVRISAAALLRCFVNAQCLPGPWRALDEVLVIVGHPDELFAGHRWAEDSHAVGRPLPDALEVSEGWADVIEVVA